MGLYQHMAILLVTFMDLTEENKFNAFYYCSLSLYCLNRRGCNHTAQE